MRRAQAELAKFQRSLQRLDYTRDRMERLFSQGQIKKADIDTVYEALFLRAVTSFEAFIEQLFLSILAGRIRYNRQRVRVLITVASGDALMQILLQGNAFMQWLPFNNTEKRAKLYLREGRPFTELSDGDKSQLKTITVIRNAIAHKSDHAVTEFNRTVLGSQPLLQSERSPAGFLRSRVSSGPAQSRFEVYMGQLGRCAGLFC